MFRSLVILLAAVGSGCSGQPAPPAPSDPASAKEALAKVLESWKAGDTLDAFKAANPTITPVNRPWQQGQKLLEYTVDDGSQMNGYDVQFTVRETLAEGGKKGGGKVTYNVSTTPKLVVVRTDPSNSRTFTMFVCALFAVVEIRCGGNMHDRLPGGKAW